MVSWSYTAFFIFMKTALLVFRKDWTDRPPSSIEALHQALSYYLSFLDCNKCMFAQLGPQSPFQGSECAVVSYLLYLVAIK